jgi:hypothetical protein
MTLSTTVSSALMLSVNMLSVAFFIVKLSVIMLIIVMPTVIMLKIMAPTLKYVVFKWHLYNSIKIITNGWYNKTFYHCNLHL